MKKIKIGITLLFVSALLFTVMPTAEATPAENTYGVNINGGFGFANNLRMADRLNSRRDFVEALGYTENTEQRKEPILYSGIEAEPRAFLGNIVFGLGLGYHKVMTGKRTLTSGSNVYTNEMSLKFIVVRASAYYKVGLSDSSFILLGGGFGYYRGTMEDKVISNGNVQSDKDTQWVIGWHTGLEYNMEMGPVVLSFGVFSRFAEAWNFKLKPEDPSTANNDNETSGGLTGFYLQVGVGYIL